MKLNRTIIKKYILQLSVFITSLLILTIYFVKPNIIFNRDGTYKQFGLGNKSKTVFPMWYSVIMVSVAVYCAIRFYLIMHRI
jgi:hypothetical protein